jgi:hypothetical protein
LAGIYKGVGSGRFAKTLDFQAGLAQKHSQAREAAINDHKSESIKCVSALQVYVIDYQNEIGGVFPLAQANWCTGLIENLCKNFSMKRLLA